MEGSSASRLQKAEAVVCISILAAAVVSLGVAAVKISFMNPWLSQSDPSAYAALAKNLVQGRGYTADYIWIYFHHYPSITHPEDTWPPLMPLLMAGSFLLFGVSAGAARLPVIFSWLALGAMVYFFSSRRRGMGHLAGLVGASLVLLSPEIYRPALRFPFNDVVFAALMFPCLWFIYRSRSEERPGSWTLLSALFAALCIYLKFQGSLAVMVYVAWNFMRGKVRRWALKSAVLLLLLTLAGTPLFIRNMMAFGRPTFPNASALTVNTSIRDTPSPWWNSKRLRGIWYDNPMTYSRAIREYGAADILLVKPMQRIAALARGFAGGRIISPWILAGLIPGIVFIFIASRRFATYLTVVLLLSITIVVLGHYEGRYFLFLVPWAAVAASWGYVAVFRWVGSRTRAWIAYPLAAALIVSAGWLPAKEFSNQYVSLKNAERPFPYEKMVQWVCGNTPPGSAFMAFSSFELAFECDRPTAWLPNEPYEQVRDLMKGYGVRYLLIENPGMHAGFLRNNKAPDIHWRWMLPLYLGREEMGFVKLFEIPGKYIVYRVPWAEADAR